MNTLPTRFAHSRPPDRITFLFNFCIQRSEDFKEKLQQMWSLLVRNGGIQFAESQRAPFLYMEPLMWVQIRTRRLMLWIHLIFCSSRSERAKRPEIILLCKKRWLLNYCCGGRRVAFSSNFLCFCLMSTWEMSALCITLACAPNESETCRIQKNFRLPWTWNRKHTKSRAIWRFDSSLECRQRATRD